MRWIRPLFTASETLFDRALCVAGALVFSQAPEFMQQYLQRLGGSLDEARRQLSQFGEVAQKAGVTLERLIAQTTANADAATSGLGRVVAETETRVSVLSAADASIRDASTLTRPFVFLRHADPEIVRSTWSIFRPAVPASFEGIIYAVVGLMLIVTLYHALVRYPVRRISAAVIRRRQPPPPPAVDRPRRFTV